jgi:creatinine amidohydrolase/Fe(II)-dependent formamide hydrolase-like protein
MAIRPEVVRLDRAEYSPQEYRPTLLTRQVFLDHFPHGVIGIDPQRASAAAGEQILAAAAGAYESMLRGWDQRA